MRKKRLQTNGTPIGSGRRTLSFGALSELPGEVLFWLGNLLAGISAYQAYWQWAMALAGFVCITLIMMGSTKRLQAKQANGMAAATTISST